MKLANRVPTGFLAIIAISFLAIAVFLWQPVWLFHWQELRLGNEIVSRTEAFRSSHERLPECLDVGMEDPDSRVYYDKLSEPNTACGSAFRQWAHQRLLILVPRNETDTRRPGHTLGRHTL